MKRAEKGQVIQGPTRYRAVVQTSAAAETDFLGKAVRNTVTKRDLVR